MVDASEIPAKLAQLRAADPESRILGAGAGRGGHGHRLGPTVDTETLRRAEDLIGVELPEGYRAFLTEAGDGGAGPSHGLKPLAGALDVVESRWGLAALGRPSPLVADVDFGDLLGQPDDWGEHVARLETDPEYVAGWERLRTTHMADPWGDGRLPLVDYGCGDWLFLVVNGPRRGTVGADCLDSATGIYDLGVDFLTWYGRWLDDVLDRARTGDFGTANARLPALRYGDNPRYEPLSDLDLELELGLDDLDLDDLGLDVD